MKQFEPIYRVHSVPVPKATRKGARKSATKKTSRQPAETPIGRYIAEVAGGHAGPVVVFDTETDTNIMTGQALRFGCFQERYMPYPARVEAARLDLLDMQSGAPFIPRLTREALDTLQRGGVFYNPENVTAEELETMRNTIAKMRADAAAQGLKHDIVLMTKDEFIQHVMHRPHFVKGVAEEKYIIGHRLIYDLGALSISTSPSREGNYGGLTVRYLQKPLNDPLLLKLVEADPAAMSEAELAALLREARVNYPRKPRTSRREAMEAALTKRQKALARKGQFPGVACKKLGFAKFKYSAHGDKFGNRLQFVDTQTLARALLGAGPASLKALLGRLNIKDARKGTAEFHGAITPQFIAYCRDDVMATWRIYQELRAIYNRCGVARPIHHIYSEASLAKAHLETMGIIPFMKQTPDFPREVLGAFIEALYGGRADARYVKQPIETIPDDFTSEYPSVNAAAMMHLQRFLIAERVGYERGTATDLKKFIESVTLDDLQNPETWKRMVGVVRIDPHNDILPYRVAYVDDQSGSDDEAPVSSVNIGINIIKTACPAWYAVPDVIASKLLTGRTPRILETIELKAHGVQSGLKPINLYGNPDYRIDLTKDDLFTRLIELRVNVIKAEMKSIAKDPARGKTHSDYIAKDAEQNGVKTVSNSGSYGICIEYTADERKDAVPVDIYFGGSHRRITARASILDDDGRDVVSLVKAETAGKFFSPVGVLIPAAGRLLLAIGERLANDRGLLYACTDTDAMEFARPAGMSREDFRSKVAEIAGPTGWFENLKPFAIKDPYFKIEDANFRLKDDRSGETTDEREPLYALCISAKRYVLYNRRELDGRVEYILRKASQHGTGDIESDDYDPLLSERTSDDHPAAPVIQVVDEQTGLQLDLIDEKTGMPVRDYGAISRGRNSRLMCDLWRIAIREYENGTPERISAIIASLPSLQRPHYTRQSVETAHQWEAARNCFPNPRAGLFFLRLRAPDCPFAKNMRRDEQKALGSTSLYAASETSGEAFHLRTLEEYRAMGSRNEGLYRRDNGEFPHQLVDGSGARLLTLQQRLADYFYRSEAKSRGRAGLLERKTVVGLTKQWSGKATNPLIPEADSPDDESIDEIGVSVPVCAGDLNGEALKQLDLKALSARAGIHPETLRQAIAKNRRMSDDNMARLFEAIDVSAEGELSIAPPRRETTGDRRIASIAARLNRCGRFEALAEHLLPSLPKPSAGRGVRVAKLTIPAVADAINYIAAGYTPRFPMPKDFLDRLDAAMDAVYGHGKARERREKTNNRARKSVAALRSRRRSEALAAWNDGEVIDRTPRTVPLHDALPPGELRDRLETLGFTRARHVSTVIMRAPLILVPLEYTAVALGAWRAHLNRARTADEFIDGVADAMEAKIAKRKAAKQRERQYRAEYYRRKRK